MKVACCILIMFAIAALRSHAANSTTLVETEIDGQRIFGTVTFEGTPGSDKAFRGVALLMTQPIQFKKKPELELPVASSMVIKGDGSQPDDWSLGLWIVSVDDRKIYVAGSQLVLLVPGRSGVEVCIIACEVDDLRGGRLGGLVREALASHQRIQRYNQTAEPGATDNPDDTQRLREDH